ncbi:MAG: methylamine utilization protein [Gammaproteobacteria bacterium]
MVSGSEMKRTAGGALLSLYVSYFRGAAVMLALLAAGTSAFAANVSLVVLRKDGRPLAGAIVTAEPESQKLASAAPQKAVVDQVDLAFVPDVIVIPVGSSVSFPNSDVVSHQVYSFSPARRFQLPLYRGKQHSPVVFDQPGIVTLGCNIHDNMVAYVVVTTAPFFGRTNESGLWVAQNVPEGTYRVQVWHPWLKDATTMLERVVRIGGGSQDVVLKIDETTRPPPLKGHPHSWDY